MRIPSTSSSLILLLLGFAPPATAQVAPQPLPSFQSLAMSDADLLAAEMRLLGADPLNINALVRAGELALKLGDPVAAAGFFSRAERLDPRNARIKAGTASLLVQAERPGEALRRFGEAQALGLDPRNYAADRGLAYDLIGEQERAQRDYRLALRGGSNDETVRRYALSLGIAGKREAALEQLDTLLRRSDRAAWRARAFILAMNGDQAGASRIAGSMMPGGMGQGLQPFFERLPSLRPADRAFAVHFGETRPTPERIADSRMIPALAPLGPEAGVPVVLAAVRTAPRPPEREDNRRSRRRDRRDRIEVATAAPPQPLPAPPSFVASAQPVPMIQPLPTAQPQPQFARVVEPVRPAQVTPSGELAAARRGVPLPATVQPTPIVQPAPGAISPVPQPVLPAAAPAAQEPPVARSAAPVVVAAAPSAITPAAPEPVAPRPVRSEDSILAAIIADIPIPGSELDVAAPAPAAIIRPTVEPIVATAPPEPAGPTAAERRAIDAKKGADAKKLADAKKAAEAKKLAEAAKKAADLKKKNDPARLEPERIWVQVAGGANEATLSKEWARVRDKAPAAFKGKSGWTTPLRLTNRVLAGPFKSDAEARSFVNLIAKSGVSGFTFTSEAGQKITKLAAK